MFVERTSSGLLIREDECCIFLVIYTTDWARPDDDTKAREANSGIFPRIY